MAQHIRLLDQNTINKIAAGEVVERPASIVKELVENSIDANSDAITIDIKDGGISLIRITDNGKGIDESDVRSAFVRHSTSKIESVDDLHKINSLGFRGEALASIASVSQMQLITKTKDSLTGVRYVVEGGIEKSFQEIGCPEGTTMIVENIFFNTPVRKKFLKSQMAESGNIGELINRLAIGNPHISFKFTNNGQTKLYTTGNNSLKDCVFSVYGKDITNNLIEVDYNNQELKVKGFIGKTAISRSNRAYENYYINGRYVKSKVIQKAIEDAYKSKLTVHQYPFTVINIIIDLEAVDVNVHPTKMEVRFNNETIVYQRVLEAISNAIMQSQLIPEISIEKKKADDIPLYKNHIPEPFEYNRITNKNSESYKTNSFLSRDKDSITGIVKENKEQAITNQEIKAQERIIQENKNQEQIYQEYKTQDPDEELSDNKEAVATSYNNEQTSYKGEQISYNNEAFLNREQLKNHKIIGQLFDTYWIVEFKEKLYIIDQHAAHERVLYEKILTAVKDNQIYSQQLLQPIIVNLSLAEKNRFFEHKSIFRMLGFDIEEFGKDAIAIREVPFIFEKPLKEKQFLDIIDRLAEEYKEDRFDILLDDIATLACKAAVKAHDKLTMQECYRLIEDLLDLENPYNCPHGRPTIVSMTRYELEKKFKRIQ